MAKIRLLILSLAASAALFHSASHSIHQVSSDAAVDLAQVDQANADLSANADAQLDLSDGQSDSWHRFGRRGFGWGGFGWGWPGLGWGVPYYLGWGYPYYAYGAYPYLY